MSYTKLDMQNGTITLTGPVLIDNVPEAIESLKSEYERAKAIMGNPLLDTRGIDEAMLFYRSKINKGVPGPFRALVEFYQSTLVMWRELESDLHVTADSVEVCASGPDKEELLADADRLRVWRDKIAAILEAHKQHMPEGL